MGGKEVSGPLSKICCEKKSHTRFEIYWCTVYENECVERTSGFIQDPGSLNFHRLCFDTGNHFGSYETKPPLFCIPFLRLLQAGASVLPLSGGKARSRARRFWNRFSCKGHSAGHRATLQHSKGHTRAAARSMWKCSCSGMARNGASAPTWASQKCGRTRTLMPLGRDLWQGVLFLAWFMIFKSCAFLAFVGFYLVQQDAFIDAEEKLVSALGNRCSTRPTPNPHRRTCFWWAHDPHD